MSNFFMRNQYWIFKKLKKFSVLTQINNNKNNKKFSFVFHADFKTLGLCLEV